MKFYQRLNRLLESPRVPKQPSCRLTSHRTHFCYRSNDKREDDLDNSSDSMYLKFGIFLKSFVTSVTHICPRSCQPILTELFGVRKLFNEREPARVGDVGHEPIKVCQNNRSK